jgi:hypothetical protein
VVDERGPHRSAASPVAVSAAPDQTDLDRAWARAKASEAEVERLRAELDRIKEEHAPEDPAVIVERCYRNPTDESCSFLEPLPETLHRMAECAVVRVDTPTYLRNDQPLTIDEQARKGMGLSPEEARAFEDGARKFREEHAQFLRDIFVEVGGGSPEDAAALPLAALDSMLRELLDDEELEDVRRQVARERAGLADPPTDLDALPPSHRWFRHIADLGNEVERGVAEVIGKERARALRKLDDGWPGDRSVWSGRCQPEP